MPLLPDEWIQDLLGRLDIREVVERYIPLQEKGGRYWACCPFHHEKTPSFSVTPDQGMFYCYGCHKGGTAIQFVSSIENINFREACEKLAEGCGLALPDTSFSEERQKERDRNHAILEANRAAARYYAAQLYTEAGQNARDYLYRRGLSDADIRRNGLGYSPADWQQTGQTLMAQGFEADVLEQAGLRRTSKGRPYDLFRGRVMFPIIDASRNVVGFGARVLDNSEPKYLNTSDTPVFSKSRNLYHANVIRQLRDMPYVLLMEGYMDVVGADRFGIRNAVATLGTALTAEQARMLKRLAVPVYISYDGDSAGIKAAQRAIGILEEAGVETRVVIYPDGLDPDELLRDRGREAFEKVVGSALEPVPFRFRQLRAGFDTNRPDEMAKYAEACVSVLREQRSAVAKERYARDLAEETGYSLHAILQDAAREPGSKRNVRDVPVRNTEDKAQRSSDQTAEDALAFYVMVCSDACEWVFDQLGPEDFDDEADAAVVRLAAEDVSKGLQSRPQDILARLEDEAQRSHAAMLLDQQGMLISGQQERDAFARGCATHLQIRRRERERAAVRSEAQQCADEEKSQVLKRRMLELTQEIQRLRADLSGAAR